MWGPNAHSQQASAACVFPNKLTHGSTKLDSTSIVKHKDKHKKQEKASTRKHTLSQSWLHFHWTHQNFLSQSDSVRNNYIQHLRKKNRLVLLATLCVLFTELTFPAHWGRCVKKGRYPIWFSCVAQQDPSSQSCRWMWTRVAGCPMTSCRESAVSSRLGSAPALDVAWLVLLSSILIIFGSYHSRKHRVRVPLDHLLIVAMKTEIQVIPWDKRYQCSLTLWLLMHENYS